MKGLGWVAVAMVGWLALGCEPAPQRDEDAGAFRARAIDVPEYEVVYAYTLRDARDILDPEGPDGRRAAAPDQLPELLTPYVLEHDGRKIDRLGPLPEGHGNVVLSVRGEPELDFVLYADQVLLDDEAGVVWVIGWDGETRAFSLLE